LLPWIGCFERIDSQRGIAWRCADSLALRTFLGIPVTESTPVHASMSVIRKRLPGEAFQQVFGWIKPRGLAGGWAALIAILALLAALALVSVCGLKGLVGAITAFGSLHIMVSRTPARLISPPIL